MKTKRPPKRGAHHKFPPSRARTIPANAAIIAANIERFMQYVKSKRG